MVLPPSSIKQPKHEINKEEHPKPSVDPTVAPLQHPWVGNNRDQQAAKKHEQSGIQEKRKRLEDEPVSLNLAARKAEMEERKLKMKASGQDPDQLMGTDATEEEETPSETADDTESTTDDPVLAEALLVSRDFIVQQRASSKKSKR